MQHPLLDPRREANPPIVCYDFFTDTHADFAHCLIVELDPSVLLTSQEPAPAHHLMESAKFEHWPLFHRLKRMVASPRL